MGGRIRQLGDACELTWSGLQCRQNSNARIRHQVGRTVAVIQYQLPISGLALSDIATDRPAALDKTVLPLSSSINSKVGGTTVALRSSGSFSVVESANDSISIQT